MKGTVTVKTLLGSGLTFKDIELRGKARGSDLLEKVVEFAGIREKWFYGLQHNQANAPEDSPPKWLEMNDRVFKKRSFVKRCFKGCCSSGRCKKGGGHGKSDSHGGNDVSQEQFDFVLKIRFFPQSITKDILTFDTKRLLYYQIKVEDSKAGGSSIFQHEEPNQGDSKSQREMITKDLDKVEASACKPAIFSARFTVKTFDQTGCRKKPDLELEITPSGLTIRQTSSNNNVLQGKNPKPETVGKEPVPWSQVKAGYHKLDFNMSKKVWNIPITSVLKISALDKEGDVIPDQESIYIKCISGQTKSILSYINGYQNLAKAKKLGEDELFIKQLENQSQIEANQQVKEKNQAQEEERKKKELRKKKEKLDGKIDVLKERTLVEEDRHRRLQEEIRHLEDLDKELEKLANNVEQRYDDLVMVKRHKSRRDRKGLGKRSQSVMGMPQESNWAQDHRTRRSQSVMGEWKSGAWDARSQGQTVMVGQRRDTESPEPSVSISHWLESGSDVAFSHLLDSGSDVELSHMMETRLQEQTVTVSQRRDTGSKDQEFAVSQGGRERRTTGYRSAEHRIKVTGPNKQWRAGHVVKGGTHNHRIKQSQSVQMMDTGSQDQAVTISKKKNRTRDW